MTSSHFKLLSFFTLSLLGASAVSAQTVSGENSGLTVPAPYFQNGDTPSKPIPDGGSAAVDFVDFFNLNYLAGAEPIPLLSKKEVVWFPPQRAGDTSLELVTREVQPDTANCDPGDPLFPPAGYPIVCTEDFTSGQFCQACHDSALFVEGGGLPEMMYVDDHDTWLANWSQYGDWSTSIMRLATRDPIWQAQIETETNKHPYADPHVIQDVCFSCHGEMGERQLKLDIKDIYSNNERLAQMLKATGIDKMMTGPSNPHFCTDVFYATVPGMLSEFERGKPFPFSKDCAPIAGLPVGDHQEIYAKYDSLARDGVSCETCHRIAPADGSAVWDGEDYQVFYGEMDKFHVKERQEEHIKQRVNYEFTATFEVDMKHIMAPDRTEDLDTVPMLDDDGLTLAYAEETGSSDDYLGKSVLCGACHVLIVPQIPTAYVPGDPVPTKDEATYYEKPDACTTGRFAAATRGKYGNPLTDPCVGLGFEQATYLEWINSDFASEEDNENTCQGCHMPFVTNPENGMDHSAIMAQSTPDLTSKTYRRHRLMGINLPVMEMFVQFPDVLGVAEFSQNVPNYAPVPGVGEVEVIQNYLLNGQQAIVRQATSQANGNGLIPNTTTPDPQAAVEVSVVLAEVQEGGNMLARVELANNTGHKFPSGAGFRRSFIRFEVLDENDNVIWASGQTNKFGVICNGICGPDADFGIGLLPSEFPGTDPSKLQPHHEQINLQSEVQIYEVQAVDDIGALTSKTLALFHDAKDNRILPRGYTNPWAFGNCDESEDGTDSIFGITKCQAAYATEPQFKPLTLGSDLFIDPFYRDPSLAGGDIVDYVIELADMKGIPNKVRATLEYQSIPPGFLAGRFKDGFDTDTGEFLPATERSIYLTSHLNLNLDLTSEHPDNQGLTFSKNWTTSIHQATADVE